MRRKVAHDLPVLSGKGIPDRWIFFDTETFKSEDREEFEVQRFRLGYACYVEWREGFDILDEVEVFVTERFAEFILSHVSPTDPLYVVSHNIIFDLSVSNLFYFLKRSGWTLHEFFFNERSNCFIYRKGKARIVFLDSFNLMPFSLRRIGHLVGREKGNVDFERVTDSELMRYCKNDVEILVYAFDRLIAFLNENGIGSLMHTIGQQAFYIYRSMFMDKRIRLHVNNKVNSLERASYGGGRTECFQIGEISDKVVILDVNSMYPFVMREFRYPVRLMYYYPLGVTVSKLERFLDRFCVIAYCQVETDEPVYMLRFGKKVIFPVGSFPVVLTTPSLEYALEHGHIKNVYEVAVYESGHIFKSYVDHFYSLRNKYKNWGNLFYSTICKLLLNSLYGKFGQKARECIYLGSSDDLRSYKMDVFDENGEKIGEEIAICGDRFLCKEFNEDSFNSFTPIASHVTDYARVYLWTVIKRVGLDHVYYVDTDSLFVDYKAMDRLEGLISDNDLGKLKLEAIVEKMIIYGLKDYTYGKIAKRKGIKKDALQVSEAEFIQRHFPTLSGILRKSDFGSVTIEKVRKKLNRVYDKGIVLENGRVKPFVLDL